MTPAEKQRRYRQRRATGLQVYKIPVVPDAVITALLETGRISPIDALDRAKVEFAVAQVVADFAKRWE